MLRIHITDTSKLPTPLISLKSISPWQTGPTPAGVPVKIKSPADNEKNSDNQIIISGFFQIISDRSPFWQTTPFL